MELSCSVKTLIILSQIDIFSKQIMSPSHMLILCFLSRRISEVFYWFFNLKIVERHWNFAWWWIPSKHVHIVDSLHDDLVVLEILPLVLQKIVSWVSEVVTIFSPKKTTSSKSSVSKFIVLESDSFLSGNFEQKLPWMFLLFVLKLKAMAVGLI